MELERIISGIKAIPEGNLNTARRHWDTLAKPLGSLGVLEDDITRIAAMRGVDSATQTAPDGSELAALALDRRMLLVFCSDNGVVSQGVSQSDASVTTAVAAALGRGDSTVNYMARAARCEVRPIDIGMAEDTPTGVLNCKLQRGTADITQGPAMTRETCIRAIEAGARLAQEQARHAAETTYGTDVRHGAETRCGTDARLGAEIRCGIDTPHGTDTRYDAGIRQDTDIGQGTDILLLGEMGIGNTTTSAAVASALLGRSPEELAGRGAGLSLHGLERKIHVIETAIRVNGPDPSDPIDILSKVGGLDLAALCGACLGAASCHLPVLLDGVITNAAALCAVRLCPAVRDVLIASHVSQEPAARLLLEALGLEPLISAGLHLGEGSGAVLALPLLDQALAVYRSGHTFDALGIEAYTKL